MSFKDHFSRQAADYGRFRPRYPPALAAYLASLAPDHRLALDVATGNGQAALDLQPYFDCVLASDPSASQLAHAAPHPGVHYLRHTAECLPLRAGVADLLVAAQAAHWFDFPRFYAEARRVLRPGGLIALWTYEKFRVDAAVDRLVDEFYTEVIGSYWPSERRFVEDRYKSLPFPFKEIQSPEFSLQTSWSLEHVIRYLGTWSAVDRYRVARAEDPLPALQASLAPLWSQHGERQLLWPIHLRLGRQ
jgi:SAM-dependent methyltransferase